MIYANLPVDALARVTPRDARAVLQLVKRVLVAPAVMDVRGDRLLARLERLVAHAPLGMVKAAELQGLAQQPLLERLALERTWRGRHAAVVADRRVATLHVARIRIAPHRTVEEGTLAVEALQAVRAHWLLERSTVAGALTTAWMAWYGPQL